MSGLGPRPQPLTIAHVDAERGFSGGEVQVFLLMEGLRARGHRNLLISPPGSRAEEAARERGFETRAVRMANDADFLSVIALERALAVLAPDLVHLHTGRATWLGGLAARMARVPALSTRRMDRPVKRDWRTRWTYGSLVARVVAISPAVQACLLEGGVAREKIALIQSSIDPARLAPSVERERTRRALEVDEQTLVVLALASLVRRKGLDVLLDALAELAGDGQRADAGDRQRADTHAAPRAPGLCVWIAGDGPERAALEQQTRALGLEARVRFLGQRADAADLLAAADVFVLPARREGLGVSALEAMAAGRAVVASRTGGLADAVVDGVTGLLVEPGDAAALAGALRRVRDDAGLRARLAAAGPGHVRAHFLAERMVESYIELYRALLDSPRT